LTVPPLARDDRALELLLARARRTRAAHYARRRRASRLSAELTSVALLGALRCLPVRVLLHVVVAALIPLAAVVSQLIPAGLLADAGRTAPPALPLPFTGGLPPIGPLALQPGADMQYEAPVPDSAFAEILALPETQNARSRQELLAPPTLLTTVVGEVQVRNGPGLIYDPVGRLAAGSALTLQAVAGDWFAARTAEGREVWIAAELVADAATAAGLLAPATAIPPPPPPKIGIVADASLNLRDGPGMAYVKLDSIAGGTALDLITRFDNWFEVRLPGGKAGWVTGEFLQIAPGVIERLEVLASAPDPNPALVATADATVNLRSGPGTAYPKLGSVGGGARLDLLGRHKDWLKVRTADGKTAWVSGEVLPVSAYIARRVPAARDIPALPRPSAPAAARAQGGSRSAPPLSAAQAGGVVNFAMQFRGTRYAWGGSAPGGFDCSGFTRYVFAQFGLGLPHSAAGQYSQRYGTFIDRSSLQPGDIVFFANTYKRGLSHVGIYVGGGIVVQALAPGAPLAAVSMNTGYWNSKYYGALRPNL
jgi:cell wall-associated NlpC family hydrolase